MPRFVSLPLWPTPPQLARCRDETRVAILAAAVAVVAQSVLTPQAIPLWPREMDMGSDSAALAVEFAAAARTDSAIAAAETAPIDEVAPPAERSDAMS
mmetsp:Transcript_32825/g.64667  ORF Transcript_32825/g.64667 Transcript_32825/m.64667 type:complete len:98 (+) Transcript_32825:1172-1465(+)